jgi:xanthine dehydrogenase accessory factor
VEEALGVIKAGGARRLTYGISDDEAFGVGLTCGGTIHLVVERLDWRDEFLAAAAAIRREEPVGLVTEIDGLRPGAKLLITPGSVQGRLEPDALHEHVVAEAQSMLELGLTGTRRYGEQGEARGGEVEVFIQSFAPPARMYVFGATDFARATAQMGKFMGYRVTVCDARSAFVTPKRFPEADELVVSWPDEFLAGAPVDQRTVVCVLTHDPKFDVPLLQTALRTEAGYIGAMGSRRTDDDRTRRLREAGVAEESLARIRGPIGLDIGARNPQETAVAIAAEIIALRYNFPGGFLRERKGAVHATPLATGGLPVGGG